MTTQTEERIGDKLDEIQQEWSKPIVNLLRETNKVKLGNKGRLVARPARDRSSLRWTLAWRDGKIAYDLNVVVYVEDDGKVTKVSKVLVHRHASADYDYDGHTPTTRMRRLNGLSLEEIKQTIEAELK